MGKLKRAICNICKEPIKRHDKNRIKFVLPSKNPCGANIAIHRSCFKGG